MASASVQVGNAKELIAAVMRNAERRDLFAQSIDGAAAVQVDPTIVEYSADFSMDSSAQSQPPPPVPQDFASSGSCNTAASPRARNAPRRSSLFDGFTEFATLRTETDDLMDSGDGAAAASIFRRRRSSALSSSGVVNRRGSVSVKNERRRSVARLSIVGLDTELSPMCAPEFSPNAPSPQRGITMSPGASGVPYVEERDCDTPVLAPPALTAFHPPAGLKRCSSSIVAGRLQLSICTVASDDLNIEVLPEIIPGLHVGSHRDVCDVDLVRSKQIRYYLCVAEHVDMPPHIDPEHDRVLHIPLLDAASTKLLDACPAVFRFLDEAAMADVPAVIFCHQGKSRSVALAVAYVMYVLRTTAAVALGHIQSSYPNAEPNFGFVAQLGEMDALVTEADLAGELTDSDDGFELPTPAPDSAATNDGR